MCLSVLHIKLTHKSNLVCLIYIQLYDYMLLYNITYNSDPKTTRNVIGFLIQ